MSKIKFAIIADDNTGATDAAGMLTEKGVRTCLLNDFCNIKNVEFLNNFDALVLGTQSRSVSPKGAYQTTKKALQFIDQFSPCIIQIKYCSTFDSTQKGNIGQFLDAAIDYSGQKSIIVCPALPVNGRTTYLGHHFVNGELLSESPLRNHPLNPMTDSNLMRWLSYQTKRKVGLLPLDIIRNGIDAIKEEIQELVKEKISYIITDATCQEDIKTTAQAFSEIKIISGGSGITAEIPKILFKNAKPLSFDEKISKLSNGILVISGSMSPVTREQNKKAIESGKFEGFIIDSKTVVQEKFDIEEAVLKIAEKTNEGKNILIYSPFESKKAVHDLADQLEISHTETGIRIANTLAEITSQMVKRFKIGKLLIAGGETSGIICSKLNINELEIGLPLDPGVPYCFPINNQNLMIILKSGNFGSENLYEKVLEI